MAIFRLFGIVLFMFLVCRCGGECSSNEDCDDGKFCNGAEFCLDGKCSASLNDPCRDTKDCTKDRCDEETDTCSNAAPDFDEDGYLLEGCEGGDDCDDLNPDIHPGAEELCNFRDDDCDGIVQEDKDGDRHFDPDFCADGDDCDDEDPDVYPGAPEVCDGVDNNCVNGIDDEEDTDNDGFIDITCTDGDDCDDEDDSINPGAVELCNLVDDNCDGDLYGDLDCLPDDTDQCITECESIGTTTCTDECEWDACVPPAEECNGKDDDCDTVIDNDLICEEGEIVPCITICSTVGSGECTAECLPPVGEDCIPPDEILNGIDDDCDGEIDEDLGCIPGSVINCITECDSNGIGYCTYEGEIPPPEDCYPFPEDCSNGKDDDCDGYVDSADEDCWD